MLKRGTSRIPNQDRGDQKTWGSTRRTQRKHNLKHRPVSWFVCMRVCVYAVLAGYCVWILQVSRLYLQSESTRVRAQMCVHARERARVCKSTHKLQTESRYDSEKKRKSTSENTGQCKKEKNQTAGVQESTKREVQESK